LDLRAILDSIREDFHIQIEQTSAVIEYGELPPVYGDRIQVSQILCNLLSNALRYRAPDRPLRVRVSGRPEPELVEVSVEDNGVGIEPAYQERIWEMFYHVDPAGKNTDGEGIGLTIVRQAVERHGGRVWVESTPGVGSTFHFTLPRQPLEA
jgi:signal transduction histidine kinase